MQEVSGMTPTRVQRPENLAVAVGQPLSIFGMPADRETIFSDHHGIQKSRIERRQRKLIAKSAFIKFFLRAGERLRCLTTAYAPTDLLDQLLTGPAFLIFNRSFLIFTNRRILHVPTHFNRSPHSAVSQIAFEDVAAVDLKGRDLIVRYKNGRQETFPYTGRAERKKIKMLLSQLPLSPKEGDHLQDRVHLCPSCSHPIEISTSICPACKLRFKSKAQARWRALLVPGGGYFFSHHPAAGVSVGLVECLLAGIAAFAWSAFNQGIPISVAMLVLPMGGLTLIKCISVFHAGRLIAEQMPENQDFVQQRRH
jgi:hypothetical protein